MDKSLKPSTTIEQQIEILKKKNMVIRDEAFARETLSSIHYYRLRAYWIGLLENEKFDSITFEHIYELYKFDEKLRQCFMKAIEPLEIKLRSQVAHRLAIMYGQEGYKDAENFKSKFYHEKFITALGGLISRQRDHLIIEHHDNIYGGRLPVWAAFEFISFGELSKCLKNMKSQDQKAIVNMWNGKPPVYSFLSWVKLLVLVRNICAHYGRLYNLPLHERPILLRSEKRYGPSGGKNMKIFQVLIVLRYMMDHRDWRDFSTSLSALIREYESVINITFLGLPTNWEGIIANISVQESNEKDTGKARPKD